MSVPRLELDGVSKSFGTTSALDGVSFELLNGECHVLAGENGAGKSTLIRILSGVYPDYSGEVRVAGSAVRLSSPAVARAHGIATIHQELSLVPSLSVVDNFLLSEEGRAFELVARGPARRAVRALFAELDLELDPDRKVETLSLSERQLVEIARALRRAARILILDEPTSALSEPDATRLFRELERVRGRGTSVIYISHRMDEIRRVADRITVLRDGKRVLSRPLAAVSDAELVHAMLGRELDREHAPAPPATAAPPRLRVERLGRGGAEPLAGVSFELGAGEVLGVSGLRGSGAAELVYALYGARGSVDGSVLLDGAPYRPRSPRAALRRGLALLASDRALSVFPDLGVGANTTLSALERWSRWGFLDLRREARDVAERVRRVGLRARSPRSPARELSGGNQQKLALLRCLSAEPRVLLLDDPTRGVDVGAKAEIYAIVEELARSGKSVVLFSSELEELVRLCSRVLVFARGRLSATLAGADVSRERLLSAMIGAAS